MARLLRIGGIFSALALVALTLPQIAKAVTIGQIDTFQDGTTDNWFAGGLGFGQFPPVPPHVVPTGGPDGAGDQFLVITSQGGNGPGSRLVAINGTQWAGNYLAAGVTEIGMDLRNPGSAELTIRLQINDEIGGAFPTNEVVTTLAAVLPVGDAWTHMVFPLSLPDLTTIEGSATLALRDATLLWIIDSPTPTEAVPIAGILGVDNIRAIPEPWSLALAGSGLLALAGVRRGRRPRQMD